MNRFPRLVVIASSIVFFADISAENAIASIDAIPIRTEELCENAYTGTNTLVIANYNGKIRGHFTAQMTSVYLTRVFVPQGTTGGMPATLGPLGRSFNARAQTSGDPQKSAAVSGYAEVEEVLAGEVLRGGLSLSTVIKCLPEPPPLVAQCKGKPEPTALPVSSVARISSAKKKCDPLTPPSPPPFQCPPGTYQIGNTTTCAASTASLPYSSPNRLVASTFDRPTLQTQSADPANDLTKWEGVSWQADHADN
jgi:hypothetical protein